MKFLKKNILFFMLCMSNILFSTSFNPTVPTYNNNKTINLAALIQSMVSAIIPIPLSVSLGGTGDTSLTAHGVLIGEGTLPVAVTNPGTNGQVLLGSTGADPVFANLTSPHDTVTFTLGAGSLGLDVNEALQISTGFESWTGGGGIYYSNAAGSFTVTQSGTGYINGAPIIWAGGQTVSGLTNSNHYFIYMDNTGTIGQTTMDSATLFQDYIVLFSVMVDSAGNQIVCKDNHSFTMPVATFNYLDAVIGPVIENNNDGANIVLNANPRQIQINGADVLNVEGLTTIIPDSASVGVSWQQMYTNGSGKWTENGAATQTFVGQYNNSGVVTSLGAGKFGVYTLYVGLDNLNSALPQYFAVLDSSQYNTQIAANNAIDNGTVAMKSNEFAALELAQLGFIIFSQAGNAIVDVLIEKTTIGATTSSGGTNNASLVIVNTSTFDGILSATDTNVQQALETIDQWGKFATDHGVLVGRGVNTPIVAVGPTGTTGQVLQNNAGADPSYSTATYPSTTTINEILYSSANNVVDQIATVSGGTLITGVTGIPSFITGTQNYVLTANAAGTAPSFQDVSASGAIKTIAGNIGTATGSTVTIAGGNNIFTSGAGSTLTVNVAGTTNHAVQVGNAGGSLTSVGPTGTTGQVLQNNAGADPTYSTATYPSTTTINDILYSSSANVVDQIASVNGGTLVTSASGVPSILAAGATGIPLVSQGVGVQPAFSTAIVPGGGTGLTSMTAYALLAGGTTSTANVQQLTTGTTNQVLISQGSSALPIWSSLTPITATITLTAAQINALATAGSAIVIIPNPGAGNIVYVLNSVAKLVWATTAYTAGGTIQLAYAASAGTLAQGATTTAGTGTSVIIAAVTSNAFMLYGGSTNQLMATINGGQDQASVTNIENTAVVLTNPGTQFATGDSTLVVYVTYQIIPV